MSAREHRIWFAYSGISIDLIMLRWDWPSRRRVGKTAAIRYVRANMGSFARMAREFEEPHR